MMSAGNSHCLLAAQMAPWFHMPLKHEGTSTKLHCPKCKQKVRENGKEGERREGEREEVRKGGINQMSKFLE